MSSKTLLIKDLIVVLCCKAILRDVWAEMTDFGKTMTADEYEKLPPSDKGHFMLSRDC